jgi:hypothetical protein
MTHLDEKIKQVTTRLLRGFVYGILLASIVFGLFWVWVWFIRLTMKFV